MFTPYYLCVLALTGVDKDGPAKKRHSMSVDKVSFGSACFSAASKTDSMRALAEQAV